MRTPLIPSSFTPPTNVLLGDYKLVPITTNDVVEDWITLTNNANAISNTRGAGSTSEWPYVCSLEENFKDLAWLETCGKYRQLFSYIIRSSSDGAYCGCVYIYPIELFFPEKAETYDVDFSFWITQKELDEGKYEEIFKSLLNWLTADWHFNREKIFLRNKVIPLILN